MTEKKKCDIINIEIRKGVKEMDAWRDLYEGCVQSDYYMKKQIKEHEKAIKKLKKGIEDNKKFFEKTFKLSLDKCLDKSYNEYNKEQEKR